MEHDHVGASAEAVSAMSDGELERAVAELSAQIDEAEHRLLTLVRELDRRGRHVGQGLPSTAAWLGWKVGLGPVAAREKVRVAKALGELPKIDAALAAGAVSYSKVRAMTRIATPANEDKLLAMASQATAAQLERIVRGVEQVTTTSEAGVERWLRVVPDKDGMVKLEARLHADEAALIMKAIDLARDDSAGASAPDALLEVAETFIAGIAGQRPEGRPGGERQQIVVVVRKDELAPGGVSAEASPTGVAVPPETLKRMACDASLSEVTVDADGTPLDVGRKTRIIPPAIRRALHVRDGGCRFPGCTNKRWLDAHHIDHWAEGGATKRDNLLLLCTNHHRLVHEGGFGLERTSDGLVFRRPDGTPITGERVRPSPLCTHVRPPKPPANPGPPDYNWAIGILVRAA